MKTKQTEFCAISKTIRKIELKQNNNKKAADTPMNNADEWLHQMCVMIQR